MLFQRSPYDEPFFREKAAANPGATRSKKRAHVLAEMLDVLPRVHGAGGPTTATIVGSKGKGTTTTFASAVLSAAGLRVGTLTSPAYRSNRERIRVDGQAISLEKYKELSKLIGEGLNRLETPQLGEGYLSPTGLFTIAAWRHFTDTACDVWVCEAGMGGRSDEVSIITADVVGVTAIFGEHLGILGDTVLDISRDKLDVITSDTKAVFSRAQPTRRVTRLLEDMARDRLTIIRSDRSTRRSAWEPPGLGRSNARLGVAIGKRCVALLGRPMPSEDELGAALVEVRLPGRLSVHRRDGQAWLLDCAINGSGARQALAACRALLGEPATILACIPDDKDQGGVRSALSGYRWIPMRSHATHQEFGNWALDLRYIEELPPAQLRSPILAIGTISFIGEALGELDVSLESSYSIKTPRTPAM
jgi:folylpolyglutamate synthase/dihydropteroate synthase